MWEKLAIDRYLARTVFLGVLPLKRSKFVRQSKRWPVLEAAKNGDKEILQSTGIIDLTAVYDAGRQVPMGDFFVQLVANRACVIYAEHGEGGAHGQAARRRTD